MLICITDLETTGVNVKEDLPIEVGAILYHVETQTILQQFSTLLPTLINPAQFANKIRADATVLVKADLAPLKNFLNDCDYIVGHNFKKFDLGFFGRNGLPTIDKPILDTLLDFSFPESRKGSRKLTDIAIDHCIPIWKNHRALTDCKIIADIFDFYSAEELMKLIEIAAEEKYLYISLEGRPGTLSKEHGFTWKELVPGRWAKYLRKGEADSLPFNVVKAHVS